MKPILAVFTLLLMLSTAFAGEEETDRIRALENRVRELEARLGDSGPPGLSLEIDRYLGQADSGTEVLGEEGAKPVVHSNFQLDIGGQLWLIYNRPSSELGLDTRDRVDMDYLYLNLAGRSGPFGFRTWMGFRESPRYTATSPWGKFWMYEALVTAEVPGPVEGEPVSLEVGKVFVPFGIEWDHTWYGSIIYYKGSMCESDWGLRASGRLPVSDGLVLDYAMGYFIRSDELDGPSSFAGFGLEGTPLQSPEWTDDPALNEREQRDQWAVRLALTSDLPGGLTGTLGGSALGARIRTSSPDTDPRMHFGGFSGSVSQRDYELDLVLGLDDVDIAGFVLPHVELTAEHLWYDRGVRTQKGRAYLLELYLKLYEDPDSQWLRTIEVWYNYSADQADGQPDVFLHIPSLALQLSERVRFMVEYVSFTTTAYAVDRGFYFHLAYDF